MEATRDCTKFVAIRGGVYKEFILVDSFLPDEKAEHVLIPDLLGLNPLTSCHAKGPV